MPTLGAQLHNHLTATYGLRVQAIANRFHTSTTNVYDTLLDPAYDPIGAWHAGTFPLDVTDPLNFASCYPTAETLFPVLTGPGAQVFTGANPVANYNDANALRADLANLIAGMQQAIANHQDVVYRIELAGHGFTLVIRNGGAGHEVELIECLAHATSLTVSLDFPTRTVAATIQALQDMFSDNLVTRTAGAAFMGWRAQGIYLGPPYNADPVFPNIKFRWWAGLLDAGAGQRWTQQLEQRLNFYEAN